ncbi:snf2 family helicase [Niveomyces insectorum RCEF 264]|uniref:Snf2 family helicase n=1 Tax=Niveomyces insectorum RCEF 264 TaxID=1081102 RepID=A0A167NJE7_9HYPO|nr:snf2 family helicase [Niveomyces insectorum RCEF 264]
MAGDEASDDPFHWSLERLVQELCTPHRSWEAPPPKKWPEPDHLAALLREHEVDGEDLITYEDVRGDDAIDSLCKDLDIRKIPHKASFARVIRLFQDRSPAYRAWKEARSPGRPFATPAGSTQGQAWEVPIKQEQQPLVDDEAAAQQEETGQQHEDGEPRELPVRPLGNGEVRPRVVSPGSKPNASPPPLRLVTSKKRKRIAPTNLSAVPRPRSSQDLFGAGSPDANAATAKFTGSAEQLWKASASGAYLGHWQLPQDILLAGRDPLDPRGDDDGDSETEDFAWIATNPAPPGRRLQVHQIIRRYLRPRKSALNLGRAAPTSQGGGGDPTAAGAAGAAGAAEEEDVVLPALGESDEEYDSETWEEMQREAEERNNPVPRKNAPLPVDTVDAIIADIIRDIEANWTARKLPRIQKKDHALWAEARRYGTRKLEAARARAAADKLGHRIATLVKEMRAMEWRNETEIRRQAVSFEASIEDKQVALWRARMFASHKEPPKPQPKKQSGARARARAFVRPRAAEEDGAEDLTSSASEGEDNGLKDFVVDDHADDDGDDDDTDLDVANKRSLGESDTPGGPMDVDSPSSAAESKDSNEDVQKSTAAGEHMRGELVAIAAKGTKHWEDAGDVARLLCTMLCEHGQPQVRRLLDAVKVNHDGVIWRKFCAPVMDRLWDANLDADACVLTRCFYAFLTLRSVAVHDLVPLNDETRNRLLANRGHFASFCVQLRDIEPYFSRPDGVPLRQPAAEATENGTHTVGDAMMTVDTGGAADSESAGVAEPGSSENVKDVEVEEEGEEEEDDDDRDSRSLVFYRGGRQIHRDQNAQDMRDKDKARSKEQKSRSEALKRQLALSQTISHDQTRLIINAAKEEHHGLVYIHPEIGRRIRDHQIEGVRFMWNQIVVPSNVRQGCLLAHTMGLGKTMQVITLLVALAEAAASPDQAVASQIPDDLKRSKTLILCPSGLVENWLDELLCWTPPDLLGDYYCVTAEMDLEERFATVETWAGSGGSILVLGYHMFRQLLADFGDDIQPLLEQAPNMVIADEAHALKNPKSKVHQAAANFATTARIAMTGSPLSNSIEDYHSMINWVAPNYLADHREFVSVYANPIKEGFYKDSTAQQKRHALKLLKVLKDTVAPKIHRATVSMLKDELPPKTEFILYVPLTGLQLSVYNAFIRSVNNPNIVGEIRNTVQLWNLLVNLTLLLAHPKVFQMRLDQMKAALTADGQGDAGDAAGAGTPGAAGAAGRAKAKNARASSPLPLQTVRMLLAAVQQRGLDDLEHSSKVVVLLGILDEARRVGDKVLVFSQSRLVLDYLQVVFERQGRRFSRLDGDTSVHRRQAMVKNFNTGEDEVYLISTTAGGVGLNIQGANRVVIFDFKWNPIHEQQAIGRAYRIGQTKPVFVYWLITGGTFETVLHNQAVFKTQLASRVVDKKNPLAWAEQMRNYTADAHIMPVEGAGAAVGAAFRGRDAVLDALLQPKEENTTTANNNNNNNRSVFSSAARGRICKIVSTDTFEEEEPEAKLSAEELHEAANMVTMNKMRQQNPAARDASGGAGVLAASSSSPLSPPPPGFAFGDGAGGADFVAAAAAVPTPSFVSQGVAAVPGAAVPNTPASAALHMNPVNGHGSATAVPPPPTPQTPQQPQPLQRPPLPMQIAPQNSGAPVYFGPPPVPGPGVQSPRPPPETLSPPSALSGTPEELQRVLEDKLVGHLRVHAVLAKHLANQAVLNIQAHFQQSGVPAKAQWARLRNRADRDVLFAETLVKGRISPVTLANMTVLEEEALVNYVHATPTGPPIGGVPDGAVNGHQGGGNVEQNTGPVAQTRRGDPDLVRLHWQRAQNRESRAPRGDRSKNDSLAMQDVLDRRRGKHHSSVLASREPLWLSQPTASTPPSASVASPAPQPVPAPQRPASSSSSSSSVQQQPPHDHATSMPRTKTDIRKPLILPPPPPPAPQIVYPGLEAKQARRTSPTKIKLQLTDRQGLLRAGDGPNNPYVLD